MSGAEGSSAVKLADDHHAQLMASVGRDSLRSDGVEFPEWLGIRMHLATPEWRDLRTVPPELGG
jgi:hypothetical protein